MKKWIKGLTLAAIIAILTMIVFAVPVFAEDTPSADCIVTLRANREDFEDREVFIPMGTQVPVTVFEEAEASLRTETECVYGWYLDEACTKPWNKDSDTANENVVLYADLGFTLERMQELAKGYYYAKGFKLGVGSTGEQFGLRLSPYSDLGFNIMQSNAGWEIYTKPSTIKKMGEKYTMKTDATGGLLTVIFSGEEVIEVSERSNSGGETTFLPCLGVQLDFCGGMPHEFTPDFLCANYSNLVFEPAVPGRGHGAYQFAGWFTDPVAGEPISFPLQIDRDITIYAHWQYLVTLKDNFEGGKTNYVWVDPGASVPNDFRPSSRENIYHFKGWSDDEWSSKTVNYPITEPMTLWARWDTVYNTAYAVHYDANGHGISPKTFFQVIGGIIPIPEPETTDELYTFDCWCYDKALKKPVGDKDTSKKDLWLYARWLEPSTVHFDTQGYGAAPEDVVVKLGNLVPEPEALIEAGHVFRGWYKDIKCTEKWDFAVDTVTGSSLTLYAGWGNEVYVGIDPCNGQDPTFVPGVSGERIDLSRLPSFTNGDLEMEGYYTDSKYTVRFDPERDVIPENGLELYIKWTGESNSPITASTFFKDSGTAVTLIAEVVVIVAGVLLIVKKKKKDMK